MSKRTTPSDKVVIDPLFGIPEGAEDQFVYADDDADLGLFLDSAEYDPFAIEFEDGSGDIEDGLAAPENIKIVSQKLKKGANETQVVDIVIEIEEIDGAVDYEIQVVKL